MLNPLSNRVVVRPIRKEEVTEAGIILPNENDNAPEQGDVQAVGPDVKGNIKKGDIVVFARYTGQEFEYKKTIYIILLEIDVVCTITKD